MGRSFWFTVLALGLLLAGVSFAQTGATTGEAATVEVIATGAPLFGGANGVAFGPDDRLYVATVGTNSIRVLDPESGEVLEVLGPEQGVSSPDDLTFGPDGSLYWTALLTGEVGRLSPDGVKRTVAQLTPGVNPITFSDDGRLFVGQCLFDDGLYEIDPDGAFEPRMIADELAPCALNAMDFGPDGYLYGPRPFHGLVARVDVDSGEFTTVADGFVYPVAVKFDGQGRLFVLDDATGEVLRVDPDSGERELVATLRPGLDNLAFDAQGRLFVSNFTEGEITEVLADGGTRVVSPGGMITPAGVMVRAGADGESVVVADVDSLRAFGGASGEPGEPIANPGIMPVTVWPDGDALVLTSWVSNMVMVWDPVAGEALEAYGDFATPLNAVRFQGDLVVAELGSGSLVRMTAGNPGQRDPLPGEFAVPVGLLATDDALWASDWATGMVWRLAEGGELLSEPVPVATDLAQPEGLALNANGDLLVVETGAGRLSSIDLASGAVTVVAEGLELGMVQPDFPPTYVYNGVAVGPSGSIYVSGDVANVLYRIDPAR